MAESANKLGQNTLHHLGYPELIAFLKDGSDLRMFTEHHFRINHRFDVFPTDRPEWAWHDIKTGHRGRVVRGSAVKWITEWLAEHPVMPAAPLDFTTPFTQIVDPTVTPAHSKKNCWRSISLMRHSIKCGH